MSIFSLMLPSFFLCRGKLSQIRTLCCALLLAFVTKSEMEGATHRPTELEIEARMAREQAHKSASKATKLEKYSAARPVSNRIVGMDTEDN